MVTVRGEKVLPVPHLSFAAHGHGFLVRVAPGQTRPAKTDGTEAALKVRARSHAGARASQWQLLRIQSMWAEICIHLFQAYAAQARAICDRKPEVQAGCASSCGLCSGGFLCIPFRLGSCLFKDTHDFGFEFPKIDGENRAARMKDEIAVGWEQISVTAQDFAHAALDAIALVRLA